MYCRNCGEFMDDNQAVCLKCGVPAGKGNSCCPNCGKIVVPEAIVCVNCGVALNNTKNNNNGTSDGIKKRSIVTAIILSLVTCGIYSIYWFVCLTNEMNKASGKTSDTSGGVAFLLTLVTCGIYGIYWAYKMGEKRDIVANEKGSTNVLYIILAILGLNIVIYALVQDSLNKSIDNN